MSDVDLGRMREVFARATELAGEQRRAFLDVACGGAVELRTMVERLLDYDSGFAPDDDDEVFLKNQLVRAVEATTADDPSEPAGGEPALPSHIGRYRIVRRHGEGGMGIVYEAEQIYPRRTVALKVIRADCVSRELASRFKNEAQILARLQHRGIAQVYKAGMSEDGRPYFAMEFIRGVPLDEYARCHEFDPRACLNLLALVCDAVQHAHDNGIVHRDLKPGNILVDEAGEPKILDFGVAHVTAADLLATSSQTRTGQLLGTLSYMSPEQLSGNSSVLDGRSDVYALGVILFELLAGRKPHHLDGLPVHEVARVIEQEEPSRLGSVNKFYRGDVEIIVAKALEKDRTRRYASAADLASDIRRYLRGQPILARPASAPIKSASSRTDIRRLWRRSSASSQHSWWGLSSRSCSHCEPQRTRAQRPRTLASRANGSVTPRIRATAPGSRPRSGLSRNTTSPMPRAISTPPLSACGAGSGNICARGSTTA